MISVPDGIYKLSEGYKKCSKCGKTKPHEAFSVSKKSSDGFQWYCKECRKLDHELNRDRDNIASRERHILNIKEDRERNRIYYEAHKDAILLRCAKYRKTLNPEMLAAYRKHYRENNGQYIKKWLQDYRECYRYVLWAKQSIKSHKNRGHVVNITPEFLTEMAMNTPRCTLCGEALYWGPFPEKTKRNSPSLDRIDNETVLSENNVNIICVECNSTKGARTLSEFLTYCKTIAERYFFEEGA